MAGFSYDVFISYRRKPGAELARLVCRHLEGIGYRVFLDLDGLGAGPFDENLLLQIEGARDFVLLLTPGCLDRCCAEPDDWVRREIAHALQKKRNIILLRVEGFEFPPQGSLPEDIAAISRFHAIVYSQEHFEAPLKKLCGMLRTRPWRRLLFRACIGVAALLLAAVAVAGWFYKPEAQPRGDKEIENRNSESPLGLHWHGFIQRQRNGQWEEHTFKKDKVLYTGDQFRIAFAPETACHVYVVNVGPAGGMSLLFPNAQIMHTNPCKANSEYVIPDESNWFTLRPPAGPETIYLVASRERVDTLEKLLSEGRLPGEPGTPAEQLQTVIRGLPRIMVRDVEIRPSVRESEATLKNGKRCRQVMAFLRDQRHVVEEIHFQHQFPPN